MRYLVLGSEGQIGYYLVNFLRRKGHQVREYDIRRHPEEDLRVLPHERLLNCFEWCDFVFFLAYDIGGSKYIEQNQDTFEFISNNMRIMENTFYWLKRLNVPFIFASSQMAGLPFSSYGNLKLIGERCTRAIGGASARFWNVYNIENSDERSHVISDFIHMAKVDGVIKMRTDGKDQRQYLCVEDCSNILLCLSKFYDYIDKSEPVDVSTGVWDTTENIAKIVADIYGCSYEYGTKKDDVQKETLFEPSGNLDKYYAEPMMSLREGIEWLLKKKNFWGIL